MHVFDFSDSMTEALKVIIILKAKEMLENVR